MSGTTLRRALMGSLSLMLALAPTAGFGHGDLPGTKNAISRAPAAPGTTDPTTRVQAAAAIDAAAAQRTEPDPTLVTASGAGYRPHADVPEDQYAMARGCYALRSSNGKWVVRSGTGYRATLSTSSTAERFHFQATDLGTYLLRDSQLRFLTSTSGATTATTKPAKAAEWDSARGQGPVHVRVPDRPAPRDELPRRPRRVDRDAVQLGEGQWLSGLA